MPPRLALDEHHLAHQPIPRGIGKVIPQVLVPGQVDLRGQVPVPRRRDEEVHMRRALAMAAQQVQALLGRPLRVAAIA
ncbi:hypothetical protein D3C77_675510 [compost metagenome]